MAHFQILYPHSATEWRAITADSWLASACDRQCLWTSFEEAETARRKLLDRSPATPLRIGLADAGPGDLDWQTREKLRFVDGTYAATPWHDEDWYQARHDAHFCHVSTEQAGKIAFTENAAKGQADRQLVMSPGRYLHRFFSDHLDNNAVETWCARLSVQLEENVLRITQDADEIEDVYVGGPASCMAHGADDFDSWCHPTRVYAGPDTALAYIGARIRRIMDGEDFVVPYIDAGGDLDDDGDFLVIGHGGICSENTNGLGHRAWYCPRCDSDASPYEEVYRTDGGSETWCASCFENHTVYCDHNGRSYSDEESFVTVYADTGECTIIEEDAESFGAVYLENRSEWWASVCCRQCDASGAWFHAEDLTEYHDEWLCEAFLPEPFDDDDPDLAQAHVQAYRRLQSHGDQAVHDKPETSVADGLADRKIPGAPARARHPACAGLPTFVLVPAGRVAPHAGV